MFCKKDILRNFIKFTGKHLCQSLFFNRVAGLRLATLLQKRLWRRCFPVNFVNFLRTTLSYKTPPVAASVINTSNIADSKEESPTKYVFLRNFVSLREKCRTNTELFLVRIFLLSVRIQENTDQK